jgi:hypothetical protein
VKPYSPLPRKNDVFSPPAKGWYLLLTRSLCIFPTLLHVIYLRHFPVIFIFPLSSYHVPPYSLLFLHFPQMAKTDTFPQHKGRGESDCYILTLGEQRRRSKHGLPPSLSETPVRDDRLPGGCQMDAAPTARHHGTQQVVKLRFCQMQRRHWQKLSIIIFHLHVRSIWLNLFVIRRCFCRLISVILLHSTFQCFIFKSARNDRFKGTLPSHEKFLDIIFCFLH